MASPLAVGVCARFRSACTFHYAHRVAPRAQLVPDAVCGFGQYQDQLFDVADVQMDTQRILGRVGDRQDRAEVINVDDRASAEDQVIS